MSELEREPAGEASPLFGAPAPAGEGIGKTAIVIAAIAVVVLVVGLVLASRGHKGVPAGTILALDPAAPTLQISNLAMSESSSLSGGKSTFIDGHIRNSGSATITGIEVQVLFHNDEAMPPQVEMLPLTLIRTREPYVDTQPVAMAPLGAGDERDFRLIFENIASNWNVQIPEIHIVRVVVK